MGYFPNSCAGEVLDRQCGDCPLGYGWSNPRQRKLFEDPAREPKPCPVAFVQLNYNYDQLKTGNEQLREALGFLIDSNGVCMTRALLVEIREAEQRDAG